MTSNDGLKGSHSSMKILHIIDLLSFGGAQQIVKGIVEHPRDGSAIHLYVLRHSSHMVGIGNPNLRIYHSSSRFSFHPLREIKDLIVEKQIDILHCHLFRSQVYGYLLKRFYFPHLKLIFHEHGQAFGSDSSNVFEDIAYKHFMRLSRRKVDLYIAVSTAIKRRLVSYYGVNQKMVVVLYNYINKGLFNGRNVGRHQIIAEKERFQITEDLFVVGFAGRLIFRKGWRTFLEAIQLLSVEPKIRYLIAGDGEDRERLLGRLQEMGMQDRICYLGFVKDMPLFYSMLNCYVIPSYWEAMGLTELEAQSMNVPVIATDTDGLNEVVEHDLNCLLFRRKDPKDLAGKIKILLHNPAMVKRLTEEGLKNAERYSLNKYLENLDHLYMTLH